MDLTIVIKRIFIIVGLGFIMLSSFFAVFIPCVWGMCIMLSHAFDKSLLLELLIVFFLMFFGALFISLAIAGKILVYFGDLFHCEEQYKNLKLGGKTR